MRRLMALLAVAAVHLVAEVISDRNQRGARGNSNMPDIEPSHEQSKDEPTHWDFATILLVATIVIVVLWLTFELWIPHWEPR